MTKKRIIVGVIILAVLIGGYFYFSRSKGQQYEYVEAKKGAIIREVSVTGKVKAAQNVDLAFENGGKISRINVKVGDKVVAGQMLVSLENADVAAQLLEAQATLESGQAKLDEYKKGTRPEDIAVKQAELDKAKQDLENYYNNVLDTLNEAYNDSNEAIRIKTSTLFTGTKATSYSLAFASCDPQAEIDAEYKRWISEIELDNWNTELVALRAKSSPTHVELDEAVSKAKSHLVILRNFLERTEDNLISGCSLSDATISTYRTYLNDAKSNIVTSQSDINSLEQSIASQNFTVTKTENELALKQAGYTAEQIAQQEAIVKSYEASVKNYEAKLAKTILRAPIAGVVSKQDAKVGEIVAANANIVSLISEAQFEIEAHVPEADIAKVAIGNEAKVMLDAYGNDVTFAAKVTAIDPAETMIEGVSTYKVTFQFVDGDGRIKSGMTADMDILTAEKENVLIVPQRAVVPKNGAKFAKILKDGEIEEVEVKTGLKGSDGNIEIVEGLVEGDKVITSLK
jgi:HlyD family secretion protein